MCLAGGRHCDRQTDRLHNNWRSTQCCLPGRPCLHHPEPKVHSGEFHAQQAQAPGESPPTLRPTPVCVWQGNESNTGFLVEINHLHTQCILSFYFIFKWEIGNVSTSTQAQGKNKFFIGFALHSLCSYYFAFSLALLTVVASFSLVCSCLECNTHFSNI